MSKATIISIICSNISKVLENDVLSESIVTSILMNIMDQMGIVIKHNRMLVKRHAVY